MKSRAFMGLTISRPWPILISRGIKRIENRTWKPGPRLLPGEWFAIHAGKKWDDDCMSFAMAHGVPIDLFSQENIQHGAIVAVARFDGIVEKSDDPWFFGPVGWTLGSVIEIERVPCKGAQGLWSVPDDVASRVRKGFASAVGR